MLFATVGQGARFVWMLAAGVGIGVWYMLTALLRRFIQAGFWLTLACDLLFGAGAAVILIGALIVGSYGQARPFDVLGAVLGAIVFGMGVLSPIWTFLRGLHSKLRQIVATLAKKRLINIIFK